MKRRGLCLAALGALLLASCGPIVPKGARPGGPSPLPATALSAGVRPGPAVPELRIAADDAAAALVSFRESCPRLTARNDGSGLTRPADWKPACEAAAGWAASAAPAFFTRFFETVRVGEAKAQATGYYEPEIAGVRRRQPGFDTPIYAVPPDLVRARAGDAPPLPDGRQPLGRYLPDGRFAPYHTRGDVEDGALMGRGLEIAWAADPVEFFFLQVQGSGRLRGPDGGVMRLGYGGQNGHPYTGIGAILRQRGLVGSAPGQISGSMQSIMAWIRQNPAEGRALMRENRSYVFFVENLREGPVGALGVPVRARSSAAVDPLFVPLGAPVWLDVAHDVADGLWIAQDTGGAIKGANRLDTFWGAGDEARAIAGGMNSRGTAYLLLPKGTLKRLGAR